MQRPAGPPVVTDVERLSPTDVVDVLGLLGTATAADSVRPVSEEGELRLQHGGPAPARDVLARDVDGALLGYARVEADGDGREAELVVHPGARRHGVGTALLTRVEQLAAGAPLRVWAHGEVPGSHQLATARGYHRARVLLQMRRPLEGVDPAPAPELPPGVVLRTFRPGRDEAAWLGVNAAAFAHHPEQGRWTSVDLDLRMAEPWFDAEGFFLAWRPDAGGSEELLGFHWTKVHPAGDAAPEPIGEIYVLGIAPQAQGMRLGRALTDVGLGHLRARGLDAVLLYVEEENAVAVRLYERSGFTRHAVDVSWARSPG